MATFADRTPATSLTGVETWPARQGGVDKLVDARLVRGEKVTALSIASGVVNVDCSLGNLFTLTMSANVTSLTFSNLPASGYGKSLVIRIVQDGTGSRTFALPASFKKIGDSDSSINAAANTYTILSITTFDQGTRWEYAMQDGAA